MSDQNPDIDVKQELIDKLPENPSNKAEEFYQQTCKILINSGTPFLLSGTYAYTYYTHIKRETKDLDIFSKSSDYPRILKTLADNGFQTEVSDARWIAKAKKGNYYVDVIFGSVNGLTAVDDTWYKYAVDSKFWGVPVKILAPEEFIWSKIFVQDRHRYDGSDINHLLLKTGKSLDWKRLMMRMEAHWEVLFATLVTFRFVYPSERNIVPEWVMKEMISRIRVQMETPTPQDKICRGRFFSREHYMIDITEWGFRDYF